MVKFAYIFVIFSKRQRITLRLLNAIVIPSVCRLPVCLFVVCNVGAPYSVGWNFRQFFSPYDSPGTLVFWCQNSLVGDASFPFKIFVQSDPPPLKQRKTKVVKRSRFSFLVLWSTYAPYRRKKLTFAISSPDEFFLKINWQTKHAT